MQKKETVFYRAEGEGEVNGDLALSRCLERLERVIDSEMHALKSGAIVDFETFNAKKAQSLLEFMTLSRSHPQMITAELAGRVGMFEKKLSENTVMLEQRLRAISEICDITIRRLKDEESDGTYSNMPNSRR